MSGSDVATRANGAVHPSGEGAPKRRFAEIYRTFWPVVYARCRRLLAAEPTAEDAAQEIFLKLMAHVTDIPAGEAESRWIHRVTTNHCLNLLRNEKRRLDVRLALGLEQASFSDDLAARELAQRVIASVPDEVGVIGWLSHVDELDQNDIAQRLQISRRTVVARLATFNERARRVLRSL
jgi:RNA polymerase sigma-70 factor (ECF subfamily)